MLNADREKYQRECRTECREFRPEINFAPSNGESLPPPTREIADFSLMTARNPSGAVPIPTRTHITDLEAELLSNNTKRV